MFIYLLQTTPTKVEDYYTSWAQYDRHLNNNFADGSCRIGVDITKHFNHNYDTVY
ncbi:MAG: hypothetical protein AB8U25_02095 [Rickettsiales endosymbiont of Dermacentor nuttalli]